MASKKAGPVSITVNPTALKGKSCIITGEIDGQTRKSAEQILINAGATIEKSLNKKVQLVVLGENAGPSKLEKIEKLGIETQEWDDLMAEIQVDGDVAAASDEEDDDIEEDEEEEDDDEEEEVPTKVSSTRAKSIASISVLFVYSSSDNIIEARIEASTEASTEADCC
jgi:BRCT domain type II-containing protein